MSKVKQNEGKLNFMRGDAAYAAACEAVAKAREELAAPDLTVFDGAIAFFGTAIAAYSQALAQDAGDAVSKENLGKAYLNLSACLIGQGKFEGAVAALSESKRGGIVSDAINENLSAAHYSLGMRCKDEGDLVKAKASFESAMGAKPTPPVMYNLALVNVALNDDVSAIRVLGSLFSDDIDEAELSKDIQLNALCQLVQCQLKVKADTKPALHKALVLINELRGFANIVDEQKFVYMHLMEAHLSSGEVDEATELFGEMDARLKKDISNSLKGYGCHLYGNGQGREGMHFLFSLAKIGLDPDSLSLVVSELDSMAARLPGVDEEKLKDFSFEILGHNFDDQVWADFS